MDRNLLYKFFEGKASFEEEEAVRRWLESAPENWHLFLRERKLFDSISLLGDEKAMRSQKSKILWSLRSWKVEMWKVAAVVALVLALGSAYQFVKGGKNVVPMQSIYVPAGQRVNITLSDGTNVWLNARTRMLYPAVFDGPVRQVTIDGEAYFDVTKDEKKPFVVETNKCNMEVLGTEFNVESYSDKEDFEVALMEGSVKVVSRRKANEALVLKPDNKVSLQMDGTLKFEPVADYDLYRWKEGLICFKNKSFLSIMKELEEYVGTQIKVENKNVLKHSFTGKFRQSDGLDYALRVLQKDIAFVYERDDEHQIIYIR